MPRWRERALNERRAREISCCCGGEYGWVLHFLLYSTSTSLTPLLYRNLVCRAANFSGLSSFLRVHDKFYGYANTREPNTPSSTPDSLGLKLKPARRGQDGRTDGDMLALTVCLAATDIVVGLMVIAQLLSLPLAPSRLACDNGLLMLDARREEGGRPGADSFARSVCSIHKPACIIEPQTALRPPNRKRAGEGREREREKGNKTCKKRILESEYTMYSWRSKRREKNYVEERDRERVEGRQDRNTLRVQCS